MNKFPLGLIALGVTGMLVFTAAGCGSGSGTSSVPGVPTPSPTPTPTPSNGPVSATGRYQDLVFTVTAPKRVYAVGETVPLTFTVQNTGSVNHSSLYSYYNLVPNGIVYSENGDTLGTIVFPPNTAGGSVDVPLVYEAGKTHTFSIDWRQRVIVPNDAPLLSAGTYRLRMIMGIDNLDGAPTPENALGTDFLDITVQ